MGTDSDYYVDPSLYECEDGDLEDKAFWDEFEERFFYLLSEEHREWVHEYLDSDSWFDALVTALALAKTDNVKFPEEFIKRLETAYGGELMTVVLDGLRKKGSVIP